jgi:phosphatidylglycerophosphate synthase
LPVWVGISAEKNKDGVLTGFGREDMRLDDVARALAAVRPAPFVGLPLAVVLLALNWFGDSLDGTLARVRNRLRPGYGF